MDMGWHNTEHVGTDDSTLEDDLVIVCSEMASLPSGHYQICTPTYSNTLEQVSQSV